MYLLYIHSLKYSFQRSQLLSQEVAGIPVLRVLLYVSHIHHQKATNQQWTIQCYTAMKTLILKGKWL